MKKNNKVYRTLAFFTQITVNMLVPVFLCAFCGHYLDQWLGTSFIVVIMFFAGALAGFRNVYFLAKKLYEGKEGEKSFEFRRKRK